jgi:peptidoglycan hydrolase-like protein with peptidoglycan-binding domain
MPAPAKLLGYGDKGPRVKELQRLINNNPYYKPRRALVEDGELGPVTCSAIMQAKHFIGYQIDDKEPVAGEMLFEYLSQERPLPAEYRARRTARLAKAKAARSGEKARRLRALAIIKGELGTLERPNNSNHIKYNDFWGWGAVPYCMIFIAWAWLKAGSTAFVKGSRWAGCREMLADAKAGGHGIHLTNDPDPGCPGVVDIYGDARPDHAITFVRDNGNGTCETFEANTSKDGTYIQGVWNKTRLLRDCWWFEVER